MAGQSHALPAVERPLVDLPYGANTQAFAENALCSPGGPGPSACQRPEIGGDVDVAWARSRASPYRPSSLPVRAQSNTAW